MSDPSGTILLRFLDSLLSHWYERAGILFGFSAISYIAILFAPRLDGQLGDILVWPIALLLVLSTVTLVFRGVAFAGAQMSIRARRQSVIRHLDTLSQKEREILGWLLARNQRNFMGDADGGYAAGLIGNRLVQPNLPPHGAARLNDFPYTIPDFVWKELKRREADFPDTHDGDAYPWRVPWMAR